MPRYVALAGLSVDPDKLHMRTEIVFGALTHMSPSSPAAKLLGQPGATESPTVAPVSVNVWFDPQDPVVIAPKLSAAVAVRY